MKERQRVRQNQERLGVFRCHRVEGALESRRTAHLESLKLEAERSAASLEVANCQCVPRVVRIPQQRYS